MIKLHMLFEAYISFSSHVYFVYVNIKALELFILCVIYRCEDSSIHVEGSGQALRVLFYLIEAESRSFLLLYGLQACWALSFQIFHVTLSCLL